jgi:hypothetical protein
MGRRCASDVAYVYEVSSAPFFSAEITGPSRRPIVDSRTIDFELTGRDPTFLTETLRAVPIIPRHAVEASFAAFSDATRDLEPDELTGLADAIADELERSPRVCTPRVEEVAALLERIGVTLYRADFVKAGGDMFDPCAYMSAATGFIRRAAEALDHEGLDAVAAAWQLLSIDWRPVGAGPYRFLSEDASGIRFGAGRVPRDRAPRSSRLVPARPDGSAVVTADRHPSTGGAGRRVSRGGHGAKPDRRQPQPGSRRSASTRSTAVLDRHLRQAFQLCVDGPGHGRCDRQCRTPIYGPVPAGTWACEPTSEASACVPPRGAHRGCGLAVGRTGSTAEVRLAADILVPLQRAGTHQDVRSDREGCPGLRMDLIPVRSSSRTRHDRAIPHAIPASQPSTAIGGWRRRDPGGLFLRVTDADNPEDENYMGFSDPVVDRLSAAAMTTYDQAERARVYRELQRELATQLPVVFLWASDLDDVVSPAVSTIDGPLDLGAPFWGWRPERLVAIAS